MTSTFRWNLTAVAAVLACLAGMAFASPPDNPFEGSWSGTYVVSGGGGTVEFTITGSGVLHGSAINSDGTATTLIARVSPDGSMHGVAIFDESGNAAESYSGSCWIDGGGNMVCDLTGRIQDRQFTFVGTVAPV